MSTKPRGWRLLAAGMRDWWDERLRDWGALVLLLLVSLLPLFCLVDGRTLFPEKPRRPGGQQRQGAQAVTFSVVEQREFILKEYETVANEISSRIEQEHLLFVLKFTVVGGVLGLIFKTYKIGIGNEEKQGFEILQQSSGVAVCCWAAVAVAAIIDVRIFFNANLIIEAGAWIRELEGFLLSRTGLPGWENHLAESNLITSDLRPLIFIDRQLLTWTLYVVTLGIFVPRRNDSRQTQRVLDVALIAVPFCFVLFWFVGVNFYFNSVFFERYCGLCIVCMCLT